MKELDTSSKAEFRKPDTAPPKEKEAFPFTLQFVNHSHLDYAWYRRRASSKIRESELLDGTDKALQDGNITTFTIEQSVAGRERIRDLRKDRAHEFTQLCKEGKYELIGTEIQQEIFLSGEEVFFWNVNEGHDYWQSIGGKVSKAFYQPDTFGVPRSFAKMLKHAGYDNFIYTRGHGDEAKTLGAVFNLTSEDGSSVLAIPMPDGYGSASKLGRTREVNGKQENISHKPELWNDAAVTKLQKILNRYGERYKQVGLPHVLLGSGCDFEDVDLHIAGIVDNAKQTLQQDYPEIKMTFGTFEQYITETKASLNKETLQTYSGELRSSAEHPVLRGIESARIPLKQEADKTERHLYTADTVLALSILREKYAPLQPKHDIGLLQNTLHEAKTIALPVYSHDAISGCGTDDVYSDMISRLEDVQDYAKQVKRNTLANLGQREDNYSVVPRYGQEISIINPLPMNRRKLIEVPLQEGLIDAQALKANTQDGPIPVQIIEKDGNKFAALSLAVDGLGSKNVTLEKTEPLNQPEVKKKEVKAIENEFYKVKVRANGVVEIKDKTTGQITQTHMFEDRADRGDEYNFCPVDGEQAITTEKAKAKVVFVTKGDVFSELQIAMDMPLPAEVTQDRTGRGAKKVSTPIRTTVRLTEGVDRVDFRTTLVNNAKDHRLRILCKTPNAGETVKAKEPYEVIERSAVPIQGGEQWREPLPIATSHMQGMIAAGDVALFTKGLQEYEAVPTHDGTIGEVAVTLLRSVGWLSRDDLSTRKNDAGPSVPTPDAQCLGKQTFEYSITMRGQEANDKLIQRLNDYRIDMERGPKDVDLQNVLNITGEGFVISAVAPSRDRSGIIVRAYNPNQTEGSIALKGMFHNAIRTNARERDVIEEDAHHTTLKPGELVTIKLT